MDRKRLKKETKETVKAREQDEVKTKKSRSKKDKKDKTTETNQLLMTNFLVKREEVRMGAEDTLHAHTVGAKSRKPDWTNPTPSKYPTSLQKFLHSRKIAPSENTVSVPACLEKG